MINWIRFTLMTSILASPLAAGEPRFFAKPGTEFGVYYYPEHWPEEQWERDITRIGELGFEFIHFAEFAWEKMEPAEGQYEFEWLDRVVELSAENGLKVIMCTPSPCIPAWLSTKHPDILSMDETGRRMIHQGARLTASLASPIYQSYVAKIVEQLASRYGNDPRIWGWQIGNEPHIQTVYDYSPAARQAFIQWLREKHGTVEALNASWGGPFWSFSVSDFEQVQIPTPALPQPNIHARLDFQTYTMEEIAQDLIDQAAILRRFTKPEQWITTNYAYFKFLPNVNPFLTKDALDFSAHTMYLTSNWLNHSGDSLAHRLGSGMELCFSKELANSTNGYTGIMELQPGQINWGKFNAMPLPGAGRMWVWHAFALGDEFVCTYRYRQPLFAGEQYHHGIMMTDGVTVNSGGTEFLQAVDEIRTLTPRMENDARSEFIDTTRTAFLWSNRNILDMENYKHHENWDSWQHIYTYYQGLKRLGVEVDFFEEDSIPSPEAHPFLVAPAHQMMSLELIADLEAYVRAGGNLVLSTRSGLKDPQGHLWEMKLQEPIWPLIGGEIEFYDHLPSGYPGHITQEGVTHSWHVWGNVVQPGPGTLTWATYDDQFYAGKAAVTHVSLGQGSVTYVGAWSGDWELEYQTLRKLYGQQAGELPFDLPPYVFVQFRQGLWVAVNYTDQSVRLPVPESASIHHGARDLPPAGVLVWEN